MKKLFLFKTIGSYLGGMAGATAETIQEAFEKINPRGTGYPLLTQEYVAQHTDKDGRDENYDGEWGFVFFEMVYADKDMLFCEIHDG